MTTFSPHAHSVASTYARLDHARILQQSIEDEKFNGKTIELRGNTLRLFGNASYLGLHADDRLKMGAIAAMERYGVQFSSSRAYMTMPIVAELEALLSKMFGHPALLTLSTSLAHLSAMPVLMTSSDALLLDQKAHASLQIAALSIKGQGARVEFVRHNDMAELDAKIRALKAAHRRIWYITDGIFSMYGNFAPFDSIKALMAEHEELFMYIDDAHGMSWTGLHGRGSVLSAMDLNDRMVMATSLNKGFGANGGALVFPNEKMREMVLRAGPSLLFSGPVSPAGIGAGIASAKIHLSNELTQRQQKLFLNIKLFLLQARKLGLPLADESLSPVFFIGLSKISAVNKMVCRLQDAGFFVNPATYPAVPIKNSGVRITLTSHHDAKDIDALVNAIAGLLPVILEEEGVSIEKINRTFGKMPDQEGISKPEWQEN